MLHYYSNPGSLSSNGNSCDGTSDQCDNRFTFCLRPSTDIGSQSTNKNNCSLGRKQTQVFSDTDDKNFANMTGLGNSVSNPMVFAGEVWPVSFMHAGEFIVHIKLAIYALGSI